MTPHQAPSPLALLAVVASLTLCSALSAVAAPVTAQTGIELKPAPLLEVDSPPGDALDLPGLGAASGQSAIDAIHRGRWSRACTLAHAVLARRVADVDALGVFALCAAIRKDTAAAGSALERLRVVEVPPYYGLLTQGLLHLADRKPEQATAALESVLRLRANDPLALYFSGEALHAQKKDQAAIAAFKAVLSTWPDHTPALTAAARLLAAQRATRAQLQEALAMSERAVAIDPTRPGHWQLLADLCRLTGQPDRANAITLQYPIGTSRLK